MQKFCFFFVALFFTTQSLIAQNYSNKGTDFWITYPAHIDGLTSVMGIYITSDKNATGTITVNGVAVPFTVTANTVTEKFIGSTAAADASNSYVYLSANGINTKKRQANDISHVTRGPLAEIGSLATWIKISCPLFTMLFILPSLGISFSGLKYINLDVLCFPERVCSTNLFNVAD